jgi:uncharacterized protein
METLMSYGRYYFGLGNSRIAEAINFSGNQHAADAFFWKTYNLKLIPDQLM